MSNNKIQQLIDSNRVVLLKDIEGKTYTIGNNKFWDLPDFVFHGDMTISDIMVFLHDLTLNINHERELLIDEALDEFILTIGLGDAKYLVVASKDESNADVLAESSKAPNAYCGAFSKVLLNIAVSMEKGETIGVM